MAGLAFALLETTGRTVLSAALRRTIIGLAFEAFRFPDLDGAANKAFEGFEGISVLASKKRNRHSVHVGPTGPTDAVNVILGVRRKVKIDDVSDPVDINSASRNVGGDQDPNLAILEILQGAGSLILAAVGMNGSRRDLVPAELPGHPIGSVFGPGKDKD
jgi:hypothetical protein